MAVSVTLLPGLSALVAMDPWLGVPELVRQRYKQAADIKRTIARVAAHLSAQPGYGYVWWNPEDKAAWVVLGDGDENDVHQRWCNALKGITGVRSVRSEAETNPPDRDNWIRVKAADGALGFLNKPLELGGRLTGGPSPLSNALVGALLTGGLGYGAGTMIENTLPEGMVERGRLRRSLGLVGAAAGTTIPAWQASVNAENSRQAGKPLGWNAWTTPNEKVPLSSGALGSSANLNEGQFHGDELAQIKQGLAGLPAPDPLFAKAAADYASGAFANDEGGALHSVPMDAFNNAIWNDVHAGLSSSRNNPYGTKSQWGDNNQALRTPPAIGAAAAGLVSGIGAMYGNPSLLSPRHFIAGLAAAGVDGATAHIAGGVLGALGGLTPAAQHQLQQAGIWSGLIRGVTGSVLGL